MQFYILHPDPTTSSHLLPNYALRHVNLREGWQMISDIGHMVAATWPGQNKPYSLSHAKTRTFASSRNTLYTLIRHYEENLHEYQRRYDKRAHWHSYFYEDLLSGAFHQVAARLPVGSNPYHDDIRYLLKQKRAHLSEDEIQQLASQLPTNDRLPDSQPKRETT